MSFAANPTRLRGNLLAPVDDGACDQLPWMAMPHVALPATPSGTIEHVFYPVFPPGTHRAAVIA